MHLLKSGNSWISNATHFLASSLIPPWWLRMSDMTFLAVFHHPQKNVKFNDPFSNKNHPIHSGRISTGRISTTLVSAGFTTTGGAAGSLLEVFRGGGSWRFGPKTSLHAGRSIFSQKNMTLVIIIHCQSTISPKTKTNAANLNPTLNSKTLKPLSTYLWDGRPGYVHGFSLNVATPFSTVKTNPSKCSSPSIWAVSIRFFSIHSGFWRPQPGWRILSTAKFLHSCAN